MTFDRWRIYYADGSMAEGSDLPSWSSAPSAGVQVVQILFLETYAIWKQDGYDGTGRPINQRLETENYCELLHSLDYYFFVDGENRGGVSAEALIPELLALPAGAVKTGSLASETDFYAAYDRAEKNRKP